VPQPPQEWFLNTPLLWLAAVVLIGLLRSPLRNAPVILKKPVSFVIASCIALGTVILLMWGPVLQTAKQNKALGPFWILLLGVTSIGWVVSFFWIFLSRPERKTRATPVAAGGAAPRPQVKQPIVIRNAPSQRFADVGGLDDAKEQIRNMVQGHLNPGKYEHYGLMRNGILLYGPRGTGKTFLAKATAGEFGLNFEYVSAPKVLTRWIGATTENIQCVFAQAAAGRPVLFFIDEIDSLGAGRQEVISDPGVLAESSTTSPRG
jgi:ATP-dependent Zn protease